MCGDFTDHDFNNAILQIYFFFSIGGINSERRLNYILMR